MANSIAAASAYLKVLDMAYKQAAVSSVLDVAPSQVRAVLNSVKTFQLLKIALVGLGDYDKTKSDGTAFPAGDVTATWEDYSYTEDRARQFSVDAVDDEEAQNAVFGAVAGEFERMHVGPEIDAFRFAKLSASAVANSHSASATLTTAADWVGALNTGLDAMEDAGVPFDRLALFIRPSGLRLVKNASSTAATTDALDLAQVVKVNADRFYTAITLNAGATGSAGGYTAAEGASYLNFLLVDKAAVFADAKHRKLRSFAPDDNQHADAWLHQFRIVHDCFVKKNMTEGVYAHIGAAVGS